jgi:vacuolar fusion protein MON1
MEEESSTPSTSKKPSTDGVNTRNRSLTVDEVPPPLPPRPRPQASKSSDFLTPPKSLALRRIPSATPLQSKATTAISLASVQVSGGDVPSPTKSPGLITQGSGDADDMMSVAPTEAAYEAESMLGEVLEKDTLAWGGLGPRFKGSSQLFPPDEVFDDAFDQEFNELDDITSDGLNEEAVLTQWKSKLKQYFILSRAGKPVWTRHGNDQLVTSYIGVILTLISFYEGASDTLKGFTANDTRFVVLSKNSLYLVAISKLGESDQQLRGQLEALYMQILSTLTLPVMERMFKARASTDLRRPLQGTERLLSALADGFTRGSPTTLLSALECLKIRKSHRSTINNSLLKTRSEHLLYGLIAANGKLVSVVRPRKHSLHPGDLHLIFNMLFEAGGVRASEGENWIPLCLPGFNNTGYVYMYVSFLTLDNLSDSKDSMRSATLEDVAMILISADKEAFYELREMKNKLVEVSCPKHSLPSNNHSNWRRMEVSRFSAMQSKKDGHLVRKSFLLQTFSISCTNLAQTCNSSCRRMSHGSRRQFYDAG